MTVKDYTSLLLPNTIIIVSQVNNEHDTILQAYQTTQDILDMPVQTFTYDTLDIQKATNIITNTSANIPNLIVNNNSQYVCPVIII